MSWFMAAVYAPGIATAVSGREEIFFGFGVLDIKVSGTNYELVPDTFVWP